jgi:outer membrane protein
MNKLCITLLAILFYTGLSGQETRTLTVDEAVKLALSNAEEIKNLKLDEEIQRSKNAEIAAAARPQISGSGQMTYYFALPQIQFPNSNYGIYEVLQKEGVKDGGGKAIDVSKATSGVNNISFFAPFNTQFGIAVNQLLFQPDVFVGLKAREEVLNLAKANTIMAQDKTKEAVKKAYYQVLVAEKQKGVLVETLKRLQDLTKQTEQMFKQGFVEKLDLDKLQVTINNTNAGLIQIDNGIAIANIALKSTLGIPTTDVLILTDKLESSDLNALLVVDDAGFQYDDRKEIGLLNQAKKLEDLNRERIKMAIYPTVAAFVNFTRNGQRNATFNPENPWLWYNTGIGGISVSQPIYDGGTRKHKFAQTRMAQEKLDNNIAQVKKFIDLEKGIAKTSLNSAAVNLEIQERNRKLAQEVFNTTKKKYEAGLGSSFELLQSDTELQRANGAYFQALYDGFVAKVNWDKAIGKL